METPPSRLNLSNIIAACIVAMGLVTSANIVAQRPGTSVSTVSARPLAPPPLSQETIIEQVRRQVLAAPNLQTYPYNGVAYKLSDATISQIHYSTKDDTFTVVLDWVWQPVMPTEGPQRTQISLSNNGYNEYLGAAVQSDGNTVQMADIRVK